MENFQTAQDYVFSPPSSSVTSDTEMEDFLSAPDYIRKRKAGELLYETIHSKKRRLASAPQEAQGAKLMFSVNHVLRESIETADPDVLIAHRKHTRVNIQPDGLTTLPHKLLIRIFGYLNVTDSVCLGLAHPTLYAMHFSICGPVPGLYNVTSQPVVKKFANGTRMKVKPAGLPLHWQIRGFMKEIGYLYCYEARKFVQYGTGCERNGCICEEVATGQRKLGDLKIYAQQRVRVLHDAESIIDNLDALRV